MPTDSVVAAIDQGTTGTRCLVFNRDAQIPGSAYETHEQHYPKPGWVEHDPIEIFENVKDVVLAAISGATLVPTDLAAIGVTNQRETTIVWDAETGEPLHNAIVWQDRRTANRVEELREEGLSNEIRDTTGLEIDAYFSATKVEWLLERLDLHDRASAGDVLIGTVDTWLLYNLTGRHVTDVTNASRTMLFDIHELDWDLDLCAEFGVPTEALPEILPSIDSEGYGQTDPDGFLDAAIPVTGVLGDQQAALFGQTCFEPGQAKSTYGTGSFVLMNTGQDPTESDHGLLTTIAVGRPDGSVQYAIEGSIFVTGAAIEWLCDLGLAGTPEETEEIARAVDSSDSVTFVPAFQGLGAPYWDPRARGTILGLTRGTTTEHVVRAAIEGIAHRTRDVTDAMVEDSEIPLASLRIDGGMATNNFLCEVPTDILGTAVHRSANTETTALGAAFAAGLAVGFWESEDELRDTWQADRTFEPAIDSAEADDRQRRWKEAVERSRDWNREIS